MPRNSNLTTSHDHVHHSPQKTSTTGSHSNNQPITSATTPDAPGEKGRISPTFAQFAYLDGAVRKTRNRAYQKAVGADGPGEDLGEGPGSPDSHHGHSRPSIPARSHKRKAREGEGKRSHKKKAVQAVQVERVREQSMADAAEEMDEERHESEYDYSDDDGHDDVDDDDDDEYDYGTITVNPHLPSVPRTNTQRHHHQRQCQQEKPTSTSTQASQPPPPSTAPDSDSDSDSDSNHQPSPDSEILAALELAKQKTILYGYPISLLTSPTRNWMPVLDKEALIYQGISEIMATCGLPNAVPMLARRLSWIGKGKVVQPRPQRNRLGKFTKQRDSRGTGKMPAPPLGPSASTTPEKASNLPDAAGVEEWNLEDEQKSLVGGILELGTVIDGINRARANSPIKHSVVGHPDEFVDVDVPLDVLLAGIESIAFTDLGFYRIYVPEKNQPFPLIEQPNQPSRLNWDLEASKVGAERGKKHAPWSVTFLGYEWESVRMELLDAGDAEEEKSRDWVTTMAGYRIVRAKEDAPGHTHPGATGSGRLSGEGHGSAASHPWGRDVMEPPPVGVYAQGQYEDVVRNWFPWAWELNKEAGGGGEDEDEVGAFGAGGGGKGGGAGGGGKGGRSGVKRKAAVEAGKKVKSDIGGGVDKSGHGGGGLGGKSGGRGRTHGV